MLRPMPRVRWNASNRRVPRQAWRSSSTFQWSARTLAARAMLQGHSAVSVRLTYRPPLPR